ncbi:hypothetical protein CFOL_v3_01602 [Cephalotus follicularis]|uniref:Uncharacterized protein n=1 Tax=Cephalotus follicularis TaxID=3775 RepID=A0A1Q3AQM8_CEPFO|nr:hypothetical protein CFOL_v3_01602 [Cephalotus follicularis]
MSFDSPSKIMNDIFIPYPYSSFSIYNIDDVLTSFRKQHFKYQMIQTNDLVLSKPKIDLFITHDRIYSSQSMIRIRFEIHNHSTILVNSYEKQLAEASLRGYLFAFIGHLNLDGTDFDPIRAFVYSLKLSLNRS